MRDRRSVEIDEIRIVLERGDAATARRVASEVERALRSSALDVSTSTEHRTISIPGGGGQFGLGARITRAIEEQVR